ncbi:MAG TPA: divalent-cation tolerance protein CutA [bacterium]|nr:divalent-cation tolerance protein CutA [bacterium]
MNKNDYCVVYIMAPGFEEAGRIADSLVSKRLAACVNMIPGVTSVFRWKGSIRTESETMLVAKTKKDKFDALKADVLRLHSYELPEIISVPIEQGLEHFLKWVDTETGFHDE